MPKPARSRDSERWGSESNSASRPRFWEELSHDVSVLKNENSMFVLCNSHGEQCLKVTDKTVKYLLAMRALGIRKVVLDKQSNMPRSMLKQVPRGTFDLNDTCWFSAKYKGRGKWVISIVG